MFWYKVISNNPSYYFKMYISEITNFLVNCITMNFQKKKKKKIPWLIILHMCCHTLLLGE